ncbi:MAG: hypothetical protein NC453_13960 [Muribaculum sp.]|nr:hypothetical protein [Muribaculum sp.]
MDDCNEGEVGLLHHDSLEVVAEVGLMVVDEAPDGNQGLAAIGSWAHKVMLLGVMGAKGLPAYSRNTETGIP